MLADDFGATPSNACRTPARVKTIKLDSETASPDVTVSLSPGDTMPDYRVYVHSARFSPQDVAALLAALWKAQQALQARRTRLAAGLQICIASVSTASTLSAVHPFG